MRVHGSCRCGQIAYEAEVDPARVGCLAQKAELPPRRQIWCKSALPWARHAAGVPGIDGQ